MIKLKVMRKYTDTKLNRKVQAGEILEVSNKRGLELLEKAQGNVHLDFAIMRISKLKGKIK